MEIAIRRGKLTQIKFLHSVKKVRFNQYLETNGDTPLMMAIRNSKKKSHKKIIKYILSFPNEVNIEDKNFDGDTALMLAVYKGNLA